MNKEELFNEMMRLEQLAQERTYDGRNYFEQANGFYKALEILDLGNEYIKWSMKKEGLRMSNWFIIDEREDAFFEDAIPAKSEEEAIEIGRRAWNKLTKHDQDRREDFYVCFADTYEDGCVNYDTILMMHSFKRDSDWYVWR